MYKVVILGTGPAGLTAAIYLARANLEPLVIEGAEPGGQLSLTSAVENFPGFPNGILGPELMDQMRKQAERFGAVIKQGQAKKVDLSKRPFQIQVDGFGEIKTESLVLSTGASAKLLGIPGERKYRPWSKHLCHLRRILFSRQKSNRRRWRGFGHGRGQFSYQIC